MLTASSLIYRVIRGGASTRRQLALPVLVGLAGFVGATVTARLTESEWAILWVSMMAAAYAIPVLALSRVFGQRGGLLVAGSTLAAAAVLNPARRRIQRSIDRHFHRSNHDAEQEVEALTARLRSGIALDSVTANIEQTINRTVQPAAATIWIREER